MPISSIFNQSNYFSSYIDIKAISVPSNPHSGVGRLYHNVSDGKLYFKTSDGTTIELGGGSGTLTSVSNVGTGDGDVYRDTVSGVINLKTIKAGTNITVTNNANDITIAASGGAGGETNTASNQGTAGVGVFLQKTDVDLEFKNINAASSKITVTDDIDENEIDIDVDESALDLANIGGELPDASLSGNVPLLNAANVFSAIQKINVDNGQQMTFYRPVNDVGFGAGFYYDFNTDADTEATYGFNYVGVEDNTDGAHRGDFYIQLAIAGSLGIRFRNYTSGNGGIIIGNNQRVIIDETGQTSAHTFTFPDSTQTLVGRTDTATLTNKTLTTPTIASIINSGTLTLPTSTDTLVGLATTDTLTNKTIDTIGTGNFIKNLGSYKYTIFKNSSTYYCRNNITGAIEISDTSPNDVLQFPLTNGGSVYVQPADYVLDGTPDVYFDFPVETTYCHFEMSPMTRIMVPAGSTSTIFRFKNGATHCTGNKLVGGFIRENTATPSRDWTGILFEGSGSSLKGVFENVVEFTRIWDAGTGVRFNADSTSISGFVTSNIIQNMQIYRCKNYFINFTMDITYTTSPINGSHRNRFVNCLLQNGDNTFTCIGVNDIMGRDNTFEGVYTADFNSGTQKSAVIHADSDGTIIDGGTMTQINFEDNSTAQNTMIRTRERNTQFGKVTPGISGTNISIIPTGSSNTTSWYNSAQSERFYIKKDATQVLFDIDKVLTGGSLRPLLFRQFDSFAAATPLESFRMETDGGLRVYTDMLRLLDSNQSHSYKIKTGNITADRDITLPALTANDIPVFETWAATLSSKNLQSTGYIDYLKAAAPSAPSTDHLRIFTDTLDTQLKYENSLGTIVPLSSISYLEGKRWGRYDASTSNSGTGVFVNGFSPTGNLNAALDTTDGLNYRFDTGGVNGNGCSLRSIWAYTCRSLNGYLGVKFSVSIATNNRIAVGFKSNSNTAITDDTDDPLVSASGIMLCQRAGDTTFQIATNNGGTTTFTNIPAITITADTVYTFRIRAVESGSKFQWSLNGSAWTDITTTIPASTTALGCYVGVQTDATEVHRLRIFGIETWSDK